MNQIIGICPVCNKGNIIEKEKSYNCNYFVNTEEKCSFIIWKKISEKDITIDIVKEIIENKKTKVYKDFLNKEKKQFSASLIINQDNKINLTFDNYIDNLKCPICKTKIIETKKGYICENYPTKECNLYIPKNIAQIEINEKILHQLLTQQETDFISGFKNNKGENFNAKLKLDTDQAIINFDTSIAKCPKCKNGNIKEWEKNFSCSNYKTEQPCEFTIWKYQNGGEITRKNVLELLNKKQTETITFKSKENQTYKGVLILNDDFTIKMNKI